MRKCNRKGRGEGNVISGTNCYLLENKNKENIEHSDSATCRAKVFKNKDADKKKKPLEETDDRVPYKKEKHQHSYEKTPDAHRSSSSYPSILSHHMVPLIPTDIFLGQENGSTNCQPESFHLRKPSSGCIKLVFLHS